jgi:hypothetical protein
MSNLDRDELDDLLARLARQGREPSRPDPVAR